MVRRSIALGVALEAAAFLAAAEASAAAAEIAVEMSDQVEREKENAADWAGAATCRELPLVAVVPGQECQACDCY